MQTFELLKYNVSNTLKNIWIVIILSIFLTVLKCFYDFGKNKNIFIDRLFSVRLSQTKMILLSFFDVKVTRVQMNCMVMVTRTSL